MILTVENLSKYYGEKAILKDVSFSVKKGEIFAILGQSGAGKSTIGKILLGMLKANEGKILFEGKPLEALSPKEIQTVFQDPYSSLNPSLSVGRILEEPLLANGVSDSKIRQKRILEVLEKVGLSESDFDKYPNELSGGQRQRVCIAAAIILSPKLIICDEPIASLDLAIQEQILKLIRKINQEEGITFLFISHNLPAVYRISDRVLLLYKGQVQELQETMDFFYHPKSEYGKHFLHYVQLPKRVIEKIA